VLHSLAAVQYALGDLDRIEHIVQLIGFVNSAPGFSACHYPKLCSL
jgi:hypothetical protein